MKLGAIVMDCGNAEALADFYAEFLGWDKSVQETAEDRWVIVNDPAWKNTPLVFQEVSGYQSPVWPAETGRQQQMTHLDFAVNQLEEAVQHAVSCGATVAEQQFSEHWRVMIDPAGHPFCLCRMASLFQSEHFGLL